MIILAVIILSCLVAIPLAIKLIQRQPFTFGITKGFIPIPDVWEPKRPVRIGEDEIRNHLRCDGQTIRFAELHLHDLYGELEHPNVLPKCILSRDQVDESRFDTNVDSEFFKKYNQKVYSLKDVGIGLRGLVDKDGKITITSFDVISHP